MAVPQNDLSEVFSAVLYNISDYEKQLTNITEVFTDTLQQIDEKYFISVDFLDYYKNYPKYPIDFKCIQNLNKYNLLSIYTVVRNDVSYLLSAIEKDDVLSLKGRMDKLPESDIKRDYNLQTTFFTSISNEIFEPRFFNGFAMDENRRSYLFKTFGYYIPEEMKESSFIFHFVLYVLLLKNMRYSLRVFESIFNAKAHLIRKNTPYIDAFSKYIDDNKQNLAECLVKYILEYTYQISNPSGTFLNGIIEKVVDKLSGLKEIFSEAMKIKDSVTTNIVLFGSEVLYNYLAAKFANSAADPSLNLISEDMLTSLKNFELEHYNETLDKYSIQAFREYLFLVYYYKNTPRKFLNVLQLIILAYVKQNMVDENKNIFNFAVLQSYFYKILGTVNKPVTGGLNFAALQELLDGVVTPQFLIETVEEQKLVEYATRISMIGYFEDIFSLNSEPFDTFINELYEMIFLYLKETVQIEPYYEYYFNKKMVFWYLAGCLKRDVLQNKIFNKEEINLSEVFYDILSSPDYKVNFNVEKMRSRAVQYLEGNVNNIGNLFDNMIETAAEKKIHSENIAYYFS